MSEPFIAEIRIFAVNFAPRGWAFCNGQLLPLAQITALFSIIGTTYGGDGRTTTALPNLEGRAAMHPGRGPGLTARRLGQKGGVESVDLTDAQLPQHTHKQKAVQRTQFTVGDSLTPDGNYLASPQAGSFYSDASNLAGMSSRTIGNAGGGQPHNNLQPYLTINYIIALVGLYPSRS